jgi:hypothetical protein
MHGAVIISALSYSTTAKGQRIGNTKMHSRNRLIDADRAGRKEERKMETKGVEIIDSTIRYSEAGPLKRRPCHEKWRYPDWK